MHLGRYGHNLTESMFCYQKSGHDIQVSDSLGMCIDECDHSIPVFTSKNNYFDFFQSNQMSARKVVIEITKSQLLDIRHQTCVHCIDWMIGKRYQFVSTPCEQQPLGIVVETLESRISSKMG